MKSESPWLTKLKYLAVIGEDDPNSAHEEMLSLTHGKFTRPPKGWFSWDLPKKAKYLDDKYPLTEEQP